MSKRINMVGRKFGRMLVIGDRDDTGHLLGTPAYRLVIAKCECGNVKQVSARGLRKGHTRSCGCLHRDTATTHGLSSHPLSSVWRSMISRCCNESNLGYKNYGGRGIKVCDEWAGSMSKFISWSEGNGWRKGLHIDRIDNDGGYNQDNCRFVSPQENHNNKRSNVRITINGQKFTYAEAARRYKLPYDRLRQRVNRLGWAPSEAVKK